MIDNQNKIQTFLDKSNNMVNYLLCDKEKYFDQLSEFIKDISIIFVEIITSYSEDEMAEYRNDTEYWSELYKNILVALNGSDIIRISDVLLYELQDSMNQYSYLISQIEG